jgi:hypothetical protein
MKQMGKIGKINLEANKTLKWIYNDYGITRCELGFPGCLGDYMLSFCHKERRDAYRGNFERLGAFDETLLGCQNCHSILDDRSKTTEKEKNAIFNKLRPKRCQFHQHKEV